jgi:hypothetical protein
LDRDFCLKLGKGHIYEGLINHLPIEAIEVNGIEIDYHEDISKAEEWLSSNEASF